MPAALSNQVAAEANAALQTEGLVHPGLVQVEVDKQRLAAGLCQQGRHVGGREGLSLSGVHAAYENGVLPFFVEQVLKVGAQTPEGLRGGVPWTLRRDEYIFLFADVLVAWDTAAHRQAGGFAQFVDAFDPLEEQQAQYRDADGQGQTEQGVVADGFRLVRTGDTDRSRLFNDVGIGSDGSPGDEVGGSLFQQIAVELVVDGQAAFNCQNFTFALGKSEQLGLH